MKQDMTHGSILPTVVLFALPMIAGMMLQKLYNVMDTFLVGQFVSLNALAAVGSTGSLTFLIIGLVRGLTTGFGVIMSQDYGSGRMDDLRKTVATSIVLSLITGTVFTIISLLLKNWLLRITHTPDEIFDLAELYLTVTFAGIMAQVAYNLFSAVFRAVGDSKTPLKLLVLTSICNIVLDILFITLIKWGVFGVALATLISQCISGAACFMIIRKKYPELLPHGCDFVFEADRVGKLLKLGIPAAVQTSVVALSNVIIQTKINELGADAVASYAVATKIEGMMTCILSATGTAFTIFCGQNTGAENFDRIRKGSFITFALSSGISTVLWIFVQLFSRQAAILFVGPDETEVIRNIMMYLRLSSFFYVPLAAIFLFRGGTQGLGSGTIPLASSMLELTARIITAFVLVRYYGFFGICLSCPFAWMLAGTFVVIAFYRRLDLVRSQIQKRRQ